ncbi:alpha/beta hydrolase [Rhodospirillum sp. A1_3_36]|uniref:alpha/beta hydrolase n=1 Tax=Rhodospirillum sp. A1_3_36 TaxID=3391666 RepID=UPI0039A4D174
MDVDFDHSTFTLRTYESWKQRADTAKVAYVPFGGGPYYGYEVGVIDAMHELGIVPDVMLPGCVGNFVGLFYHMALVEGLPPTTYIDRFSEAGLMAEKDYMKAPIPPLFPMRIASWMRGFASYYSSPEAYQDLLAPELFPDVVHAGMDYWANPTERNLGIFTRNLCVWHPLTRLGLGGYYFAPIGPFGELYDPTQPEGWIHPSINWASVYDKDSPIYIMSLLQVGQAQVTQATNCIDHPQFAPLDGRRLASASNLPWLIAETEIDGNWYRESAVRDVATLTPAALETLPSLEVLICVQIMDSNDTATLSIHNGNHDNYSLQVTEMIATIGDDDISQGQALLATRDKEVEWIIIEAQSDAQPHWTHENVARCRRQGYEIAMRQFLNSEALRPFIKHHPDKAVPPPPRHRSHVSLLHQARLDRMVAANSNKPAATE